MPPASPGAVPLAADTAAGADSAASTPVSGSTLPESLPASAPLSSPPPPLAGLAPSIPGSRPPPVPRPSLPPAPASIPAAPPLSNPPSGSPSAPGSAASSPADVGVANPAFIEERARHAYETGRLDVAEGYYLQLIRLKPKDSGPWFQLGNLYSEQGRLDAAERAYRESLRRRDDARTLHNLGLAQVKLGIGALREAQKRLPPNDPARRETQEFLRILLESIGK